MQKVSAVLPNYNNAAFLARTLNSLIKQSLRGIDIVVIDDCSTDSSVDLIHHYMKQNNNIRLIALESRKGSAYCRNIGNSLARANIIMVCDSGDVNHIHRARDAYNFLKRHDDIDIYSSTCIETNALDENIAIHFPRIFNDKEKPSLFHPTVVYRNSVTNKIKYREGNLATDQYEAFFFEAYRAGFKFWHTQEAFVKKIRQQKDSGLAAMRIEQRLKNFEEFGINDHLQ